MGTAAVKAKILVIDDEEIIREVLSRLLESAGYTVRTAADGPEGLRGCFSWQPHLVMLDVLMPGMDGWELLGRIREMSDTPVIMLTALGEEHERVHGLRSGADDYVAKPFGDEELLARVEAVLRRTRERTVVQEVYRDRTLHVDFERHKVFAVGRQVTLTPLEFRLLTGLVRNASVVLDMGRLIDLCWGEKPAGPANLRFQVNSLRKKLERDPTRPQLIETVRGFGHRYRPPQEKP